MNILKKRISNLMILVILTTWLATLNETQIEKIMKAIELQNKLKNIENQEEK